MAETMKQASPYENFKKAVEALGDDKVDLIVEGLCDILDGDQLTDIAAQLTAANEPDPEA